ncbi:MAG: group I intron-associated PD-(D/E)XK endonuclease [Candidatus Sulfotelmatobacter sp.]
MEMSEVGGEFSETITIWAVAEDGAGKRARKSRFLSGLRPVRNDNDKDKGPGRNDKNKGEVAGVAAKLTPKQLGEIAEAEFIAKVVELGFVVAKPWGDSEPYDFIVNRGRNFWRVQVKSAHVVGEDGTCSFRAHNREQKSYTGEEIDALVAYARPDGAWYVFPVRVIEGLRSLKLYPGSRKKRSKHEKWREAWEIFRRTVRRARRK